MRTLIKIVIGVLTGTAAIAGPWLDPGDSGLRHDIQVLADAGVIVAPVSTWPLAWGDIQAALDARVADLGPAELTALVRLQQRITEATRTGEVLLRSHISFAENPRQIRTFEDGPREDAEIGIGAEWTGDRFAARLEGQWVDDPQDGKEWRGDGSYLGVALGNWMLAASITDRYWGPGWQSSMIMSNNARPVPAFTLERNLTTPFDSKWLSWMGPWDLAVIWGFLEDGRAVPNARLFAMRLNFRPLPSLEVGLSRSGLWCGSGKGCGVSDFAEVVFRGADDTEADQLAGFDLRWSSALLGTPFALYTHWAGEDFPDFFPSDWLAQFGAETWGHRDWLGSYRLYIEWADTECDFRFYRSVRNDSGPGSPGCGYRNNVYRSGQTYRGASFAHSFDQDSSVFTLGGVVNDQNDHSWLATLAVGNLNRRNANNSTTAPNKTRYREFEVTHRRELWIGDLNVGLGYDHRKDTVSGNKDDDVRAFVEWGFAY
jgi:hypothetical protein